ncbi:MAG: hypothetical protein CM1200mP29_13180 [Verrucomicrobiota bacterium]|nr:MAG: hypothetical protein CM1200mP29_13180 [Verrucomicrobiota bacterium]
MPGRRGNHLSLIDSPLKELMPVVLDDARPTGTGLQNESMLMLSNRGRGHPLTRFDADELVNEQIWKMLPGFYWSTGVTQKPPRQRGACRALGVAQPVRPHPALAIRMPDAEGLFMGTDSAWRWRRGSRTSFTTASGARSPAGWPTSGTSPRRRVSG